MRKDLAIKQLYDDFIIKVTLSDTEKDVLDKYVKGDSIVKISLDTSQSYSTVSRIIVTLKNKYETYKRLEIAKLTLLQKNKWKKHDTKSCFYFVIL